MRRLGKYHAKKGPGLFWITPLIDTLSAWIAQRTATTTFAAEQTLTSDTVPVNVDAALFWMVYDPEKAALEVRPGFQPGRLEVQTNILQAKGLQ